MSATPLVFKRTDFFRRVDTETATTVPHAMSAKYAEHAFSRFWRRCGVSLIECEMLLTARTQKLGIASQYPLV